jgi:hypothetical protein
MSWPLCFHGPLTHVHLRVQYLEPIINATWDEEGGVEDVCRALQPRFREPNAIVRTLYYMCDGRKVAADALA